MFQFLLHELPARLGQQRRCALLGTPSAPLPLNSVTDIADRLLARSCVSFAALYVTGFERVLCASSSGHLLRCARDLLQSQRNIRLLAVRHRELLLPLKLSFALYS